MFTRAGWNRTTLPFAVALAAVVIAVGGVGGAAATVLGVGAVVAGVVAVSAAVHRWDMGAAKLLSEAIERMTAGDWTARVRLRGEDELGECGFRLNLMAERTAEQIEVLARQRTDLAALVDALPDAVLLADARQRVVGMNEPAAAFVGVPVRQALGQPIIALLGEAALVEIYERTRDRTGETGPDGTGGGTSGDAGPLVGDVRVTRLGQRRTYQAVAARTAAGGVVVALRDVTEPGRRRPHESRLRRQRQSRAADADRGDQDRLRDPGRGHRRRPRADRPLPSRHRRAPAAAGGDAAGPAGPQPRRGRRRQAGIHRGRPRPRCWRPSPPRSARWQRARD